MASKNTDIIEVLADTIVSNLTTPVSKRGKETAPNDKTFATVICGVNQKFTDGISDEEKNNTINKYSIPESIDDGENSYYTFKIDGAIYCKQQKGNYFLYDKVMVYIPNGDWSNMYFDYPDASSHSGGGGGSGEEHQLIVSVEAPGGADPKLGDMWLFVNDKSKTIFDELTRDDYVGMYTWQEDEDTGVQSWKSANCTVGGDVSPSFGQVGDLWIKLDNEKTYFTKIFMCTEVQGSASTWSEIYPDDETGMNYNLYISATKPLSENDIWVQIEDEEIRQILGFYQYQYNSSTRKFEWTLGGVDIAGGTGGVGENVGQHNERFNGYTASDGSAINGGDYNHAEGYKHTLNGCYYVHVSGYGNKATSCSSDIISGDFNVLIAVYRSIVVGNSNDVTNNTGTSAVFGNNNQVSGVHNALICGEDNDVTASDGACFGQNNVLTKDGCVAVGYGANTTNLQNNVRLVIGNGFGNAFYITSNGDCYAAGGYNSMGADYAEYFEWADGNPENEDRRGYLVSLDGDKIIPAHGDEIYGIISANPSVIGNNPLEWHGKYKKDVFGSVMKNENGEPILSEEYDPNKKYVPRSERPEWSPLGLVGRLIIVDNGSCKPNGYVSAQNGIGAASLSPTNIRVLRRVDDNHVEVFIK